MKRVISIILAAMLLTACENGTEGISYPKISENRLSYVKNSMSQVSWGTLSLYYDGRMYSGGVLKQGDGSDVVCETELGTVYGYDRALWSTDKTKLYTAESEAKLYSVKGYDSTFRVCIYEENSDTVYLFECLNDVTLSSGKDIFKKRLALDSYADIELTAGKDGNVKLEDIDIEKFLGAICAAALIAPDTQGMPDMNTDYLYALTFHDTAGIPNELKVYEDGYVMYMPFGETDLRYRVIVMVAL